MFDFLKKKEEVPDVGKEEEYDSERGRKKKKALKEEETELGSDDSREGDEDNDPVKPSAGKNKRDDASNTNITNNLETEKINARIEAMNAMIKGMNERFSLINQQIGEIRAMNLTNEKSIVKATQEAMKSVDIVREVKPEKLRIDYQKQDLKVTELGERLEGTKQLMETIMNEIKDLRRKAGIFIGTDALLKLNEEIKKDLIEVQKLGGRVRVDSDKSEQIFIELRAGFAENQKQLEIIDNLDTSYSGLKKEVEKLKLDYTKIVSQDDFGDLKKSLDKKFSLAENIFGDLVKIKDENERLSGLVENIVLLEQKNEDDIANIAVTIGDDHVKRVSDYEEQISSLLKIIDTMAGSINHIKKHLGILEKKKIYVNHDRHNPIEKGKLKLNNVDFHPEITKKLAAEQEIPENIAEIQKIPENKFDGFDEGDEDEKPEKGKLDKMLDKYKDHDINE